FSFLRGASHPEELVERAQAQGYAALAITDECSLAGAVRAHLAAKDAGLPLVIGSEFTLDDGLKLVLHAVDRDSYGDLAALITRARRRAIKGHYRVTRDDVADLGRRCLALWIPGAAIAADEARFCVDAFGARAAMAAELFARGGERARLADLTAVSRATGLPLIAAGDVHMHVRARRMLQDTMTAVRVGTPLAQCGYALFANGERHLRSRGRLATIYPRALLEASVEHAARCRFSLDCLRYEYPDEIVPAGATPASHLRALTEAGLVRRYPRAAGDRGSRVPPKVREQIEHELALIAELAYEPYFLTVHDIVAFARSRGILCQGRGSAANSAVCYALGITEVDPTRMSMLFERFVSRERDEPPDIDVDFEHQRREEVMQYVYAKYGRDRAALAATLITYRTKSAVRDIAKALGFGLAEIDRLTRVFAWWDGRTIEVARIREAGFDPASPLIARLVHLAGELIGMPRHLSQHVGGFVIARGSIERMVPVENAAMVDRTVIQWDKDDLDAMGLLKVDCLALGMLSAIRRALSMVSAWRERPLAMQDIPAEDPEVYAMIQRADTIGVFQIESRAQQSMLPRLKPANFYDLVIEVAIVRPGPIQGGMVHPYLRRRQGLEPVTYPSEAVRAVLERTLGVPIFQEQVMQLAIVTADFTPGESDALRRSMAAWRRKGGLEKFERRLVDGMAKNGYSEAFARQIYQQILGFGEYGFPESHSASFSLLVYVSSWLKRYHPAAFTAALLNAQPMGFYAPAQLVQDAQRHGVEVRAVDVVMSEWDCTLETPQPATRGPRPPAQASSASAVASCAAASPALRLGLRMIAGFGEPAAARVIAARTEAPFASVADLAHRAALDARDLRALADAGALAALAGHRHAAVWDVAGVEKLPAILAGGTFAETPAQLPPPSEGQDIVADYRRLGLTLGRHPLALLRKSLAARRLLTSREVTSSPHGRLVRTAGIVIGRQRPDTVSGVVFVTLEDETGNTNVIVWRDLGDRQRRELLGARLMAVYGKVEREGIVVHLVAGHLVDLSPMLGALETRSRDFH
ncbi:MAG TPA: error-prone DNA polymerase, partial [Casimicrobiaceae bacterium]|nr:error-prone DNA polymerase [Casimicrobiaceae bacterium]